MAVDGVAVRRRLGIGDVKCCARDLSGVDRAQQRLLVDDPASRDIDQVQGLPGVRQHISVDQMGRLCRGRQGDDKMVGKPDQRLNIVDRLDARQGVLPWRSPQHLDLDAKRLHALGDRAPDRTKSRDADRLAAERAQRDQLPVAGAARPHLVNALFKAQDGREHIFGNRIGRDTASDRDHRPVQQPCWKEIDAGRGCLDPAQAEWPPDGLCRRRLVPTGQRTRQQHVGLRRNLPGRAIRGVVDDPGTRPVIGERRTNFRSKLIDDDWRPDAGGSASPFDAGCIHSMHSR